jgi:hypothetical protein
MPERPIDRLLRSLHEECDTAWGNETMVPADTIRRLVLDYERATQRIPVQDLSAEERIELERLRRQQETPHQRREREARQGTQTGQGHYYGDSCPGGHVLSD